MSLVQQTVRYRTYLKESIVEALRPVFANHPDQFMRNVKVTVDLPRSEAKYPAVVIRYNERYVRNIGVGHHEWIQVTPEEAEPVLYQRFKHFLYGGDIELSIYALTSKERDWMADAVVQTIGMADTEEYTRAFYQRFYGVDIEDEPQGRYHFISLQTDEISSTGDQESLAPWETEDRLVYSTAYRVGVLGQFYSRLLPIPTPAGVVEAIEIYPWIPDLEEEPDPKHSATYTGPDEPEDPSPWLVDDDYPWPL